MNKTAFLAALILAGCGGGEDSATSGLPRGVTADGIRIGAHSDLSGVVATWGVSSTNGARMRFEEANAVGGIHGRKIEYIVEDTQYQVPNAVKATNKLLNIDEIFLMVAALGTPLNNAVMPRMFEAGVPNLFPLTGAVSMYEPLHPMKFSYFVSYRDQIRGGVRYLAENNDVRDVCLQAVATDYGQEVEIGFEQAVEEHDLNVAYLGRHKGSETDFSGTATAIKNAGCDLLVLGPFIKDAILIYTAVRDAGFTAPVVGNMVPYVPEVAPAGNGSMDGFYAVASFRMLDFETEKDADTWAGEWYRRYVEIFGEPPAPNSQIGYVMGDLTVRALEAAGPDVTVEKVLAAIESIDYYEDPFGGPSLSFSPTKHQGGDSLNLYQVQDRKWVTVAEGLPY
jgi:branched-chain amino acid transport system substrate-binding protein